MFTAHARRSGALLAACLLGSTLLTAPPAAADTPTPYNCVVETPYSGSPASFQPLQVCASFDKSGYQSGDTVKLTVSATNIGTATAPSVNMGSTGDTGTFQTTGSPVGPLLVPGDFIALPAGATVVSEVDGYADDPASGSVTFSGYAYQYIGNNGSSFGDPVSISASVTPATGNYSGTVFADSNGNGQPDPGEGIAGTQITLNGPFNGINGNQPQNYAATSDAQGDFQLTGLPAGHYWVRATGPNGWFVHPGATGQTTIDADSGTSPDLFVATPTPYPLRATATFDRTSYQVGDTAQITITLTNTSTSDLSGIQSQCNPAAMNDSLWGKGNGWSVFDAPGLTVPAGQTTTLTLSEIVPSDAMDTPNGTFFFDCLFGPNPGYELDGVPEASASATISAPANPVDFTVQFVDDDPLGGTFLCCSYALLDPASQDPLLYDSGGTVTNQVQNLPSGTYDLVAPIWAGAWQLAPGQATTLDTSTITNGQTVQVHVVPTSTPAPPAPPSD